MGMMPMGGRGGFNQGHFNPAFMQGGGGGGGNGGTPGRGRGGNYACRRRYLEDMGPDGFSQADLEGIVYDIDTAFGLLPHGGAYKESNFYDDYGDIVG